MNGGWREKLWPPVRVLLVHVLLASGLIGGLVAIAVFTLLVDRLHWLAIDFHGKTLGTIEPAGLVLGLCITIAVTLGLVLLAWRVLERKPVSNLFQPIPGPVHHRNALALGLAIGLGQVVVVFALLWVLGVIHPAMSPPATNPQAGPIATGWLIASCILAPLSEELLYRGYWFHNLRTGWGTAVAGTIPALLFGCIHLLNPDASIISAVNIALSGLLLAWAMVLSRSLWLPIGWHAGWNFAQFFLAGLPNSGFAPTDIGLGGVPYLQAAVTGPTWLSGGAFGLEASILNTVVMLAILMGLALYHRRPDTAGSPQT